jgi:hypothetical protein
LKELLTAKTAKNSRKGREERCMGKKPTVRVTKWLADIPAEAQCTACPSISFRAKGTSHRPNREEYQRSLQSQFDEHCKLAHSSEGDITAVRTEHK